MLIATLGLSCGTSPAACGHAARGRSPDLALWKSRPPSITGSPHTIIPSLWTQILLYAHVSTKTSSNQDTVLSGALAHTRNCSHEVKRHLPLGRKVITNLDSILKSRDITLSTKVRLVKAMVFPVVMYGCESWTIKKAECRRIDTFELWCWRRLLRVPRTEEI